LHINDAKTGKDKIYKGNWIRSLLKDGNVPVMQVIEDGFGPGWKEREIYWIAQYRNSGANLVNLTDGGEGTIGYVPSQEARLQRSLKLKGRKKSQEHVLKVVAALKGKSLSKEHRLALSESTKGRVHAPEHQDHVTSALRSKSVERVSVETVINIYLDYKSVRGTGRSAPYGTNHSLSNKYNVPECVIREIANGRYWVIKCGEFKELIRKMEGERELRKCSLAGS
jgi:hypothetical protein